MFNYCNNVTNWPGPKKLGSNGTDWLWTGGAEPEIDYMYVKHIYMYIYHKRKRNYIKYMPLYVTYL